MAECRPLPINFDDRILLKVLNVAAMIALLPFWLRPGVTALLSTTVLYQTDVFLIIFK